MTIFWLVLWIFFIFHFSAASFHYNECATGSDCDNEDSTKNNDEFTIKKDNLLVLGLHADNAARKPSSLNMMMNNDEENEENHFFRPTPLTPSSLSALSDVTITDNDKDGEEEQIIPRILNPKIFKTCQEGGLTYEDGEKLEVGCDSICTCQNGTMHCKSRCQMPFYPSNMRNEEINETKNCFLKKTIEDPCCSSLICETEDTEVEPLELCQHGNETYKVGEYFNKTCDEICICELGGKIACKNRCQKKISKTSAEHCVEIPDPNDSCCKKILCDVNNNNNDEEDQEGDLERKEEKRHYKILKAIQKNDSVISLTIEPKINDDNDLPIVEASNNQVDWYYYQLFPQGQLFVKQPYRFIRLENNEQIVTVIKNNEKGKEQQGELCSYKGRNFKINEEYNDKCESLCICKNDGMKCLKFECPILFGADVLDPNCDQWEILPKNFTPHSPHCCPEKIHCINNGSCLHNGILYKNWEHLPIEETGCEKHCYCESNKIECQNICQKVSKTPPNTLNCHPQDAKLEILPGETCCRQWTCQNTTDNEILVQNLEAIDSQTVRLAFIVPTLIVGLHGRVEVRYTYEDTNNLENWDLQIFAPPNDLIPTPSLEFDLLDLLPDKEYKIKITIILRDLDNTPTSKIYKIRTPKEEPPSVTNEEENRIKIEPEMNILDLNATFLTVSWRKFTKKELELIDGIQLRYRESDGKIFFDTPLIHRALTSFTVKNLKPNTKYEIGIFFIPFEGQKQEFYADFLIPFTTASLIDNYGFQVQLTLGQINTNSVEIFWNGVPYPEDKYVNIYRVIYQSDTGKDEDENTFKLAKRDAPKKLLIKNLKFDGTHYRIWMEIYLTNGKIKTSNVQEFQTKPRTSPVVNTDQISRSGFTKQYNYYAPLVIVAILAAMAIISTLILLFILLRKNNKFKASITSPSPLSRITPHSGGYENSGYKMDIQQEETMGL